MTFNTVFDIFEDRTWSPFEMNSLRYIIKTELLD